MATTQHYLWASGHLILLLCSARYLLAYATFNSIGQYAWWYKTSFTGALLSYAIVCYKSLGIPQSTSSWMARAGGDENLHYFALALFWWMSRPVPIALLPYTIFSLFHALTFLRSTILPKIMPPPPAPSGSSAPPQSAIGRTIQQWVKRNYDSAMGVVAVAEILIALRVTFGIFLLQNSFLAPVVYGSFLRQRYFHSVFTRNAFEKVDNVVGGYVSNPNVPPVVRQVWASFKDILRMARGTMPNATGPRAGPAAGTSSSSS